MGSTIVIRSNLTEDLILTRNLQMIVLELGRAGSLSPGDIGNGFFDDFRTNTGIDSGLSSNYTYDGTNKKVSPVTGTMDLVSVATTSLIVPSTAMIALLIKGFDSGDTLSAYFSSSSTPSWTEFTGLTQVVSDVGVEGIDQFVSDRISVTGSSDKSIRCEIQMGLSQSLELYGFCCVWS
jgi:hypothetical protein